jgi:hypothetical protein
MASRRDAMIQALLGAGRKRPAYRQSSLQDEEGGAVIGAHCAPYALAACPPGHPSRMGSKLPVAPTQDECESYLCTLRSTPAATTPGSV